MGKIKIIKKSTLSGKTESDDYKIYPVTKADAVFTDSEDKDAVDSAAPQGTNTTVKAILNDIRKKEWVKTGRISASAVTNEKIADSAVSTDKIASTAVTKDKLASKAVTSEKMAADAVYTDSIQDSAVTEEKLADSAVTNDKIADDTIEGYKIKNKTITTDKLGGDVLSQIGASAEALEDVVYMEDPDSTVDVSKEQLTENVSFNTQDFQLDDDTLELADRDTTLGMGYKILRPHHIDENRPKVVLTARSKAYYSGMMHITFAGVEYHVELAEDDDAAAVITKIYNVLNEALADDYLLSTDSNVLTIIKRDSDAISDCSVDNADTNADVHVENTTEAIDIYSIGQDDFDQKNTIYEIRYDFNLDNKTITIPENCVLKFEGGSFSNGTVVGTFTYISSPIRAIFINTPVSGSWKCPSLYIDWFSNTDDTVIVDSICDIINNDSSIISKLEFSKDTTYTYTKGFDITNDVIIEGNNATINFTDCSRNYIGFNIAKIIDSNHNSITTNLFTKVNISEVVATKDSTIINTTVENLSVGDYIVLFDSTEYGFSSSRAYYYKGDLLKVHEINSDSIVVTDFLTDDYSGDTVSLYKVDPVKVIVRNIVINGESNEKYTIQPIRVYAAVDSILENITAYGSWLSNIDLGLSYNCIIKKCYIDYDYTHDSATITTYRYGIIVGNCKNVTIKDCYLKTGRHGLTIAGIGGNNSFRIPNRHITVENNVIDSYGYNGQAGFDTHGDVDDVLIKDNYILYCADAAAANSHFTGNVIHFNSTRNVGILILEGSNSLIENNIFIDHAAGYAFSTYNINDHDNSRVQILGNTFISNYSSVFVNLNRDVAGIYDIGRNLVTGVGTALVTNSTHDVTINVFENCIYSKLSNFASAGESCVFNVWNNYLAAASNTNYIYIPSSCSLFYRNNTVDCLRYGLYIKGENSTGKVVIEENTFNDISTEDNNITHYFIAVEDFPDVSVINNIFTSEYSKPGLYFASYSTVTAINNITYPNIRTMNIKNESILKEEVINGKCTTSERPTPINTGYTIFDTTLNKPIYWTGSTWVDATGTEV